MDALRFRRHLRGNATDAEAHLWRFLRSRRLEGFKFRRQHPAGPFVLDFFCEERELAVELDGGQHFLPAEMNRDHARTAYLSSLGITVLRFTNTEALAETEAVLWPAAFRR